MTKEILTLTRKRRPRSQLILTRRSGESVEIGNATVTAHISKGEVVLVIKAPRETRILRTELVAPEATA